MHVGHGNASRLLTIGTISCTLLIFRWSTSPGMPVRSDLTWAGGALDLFLSALSYL
jgi:hypothetical protein